MIRPRGIIRWIGRGTSATLIGGASAVGLATSYLTVLTVAATSVRRGLPTSDRAHVLRRFIVLVPAHNEEACIGETIAALKRLAYPAERFAVHVVADNCSDRTVAIVRESGTAVHERDVRDHPGKGPALNWLHARLVASGETFDAVAIIDADSIVHPDFLRHMSTALNEGALAAQGYYGVRDIGRSANAGLRYAALACRHHLRPLGRNALGASAGLYGNGMVFDSRLIENRQWSGHLIEDAEFQMELLLDGHKVVYVPDATLEAEMPDSLVGATSQNERWELGRLQLARRYVPQLLKRAIRGERKMRVAHWDALFDHLLPPLSILVAANVVIGAGAAASTLVHGRVVDRVATTLSTLSSVLLVMHVTQGLRSVRAPKWVYRSLLTAPRLILWKVLLYARVAARPDDVTWTRTARNAPGRSA